MLKILAKPYRKWTLAALALLVVGFFGVRYLRARRSAIPKGIAWGNGRIESKEVDVAAKLPLRVKDILVAEGDLVEPKQVVAHLDTVTLEAQLAEAQASVASAKEQLAVARAGIARSQSEIELAKVEKARSGRLVAERAGSQREYDVRTTALRTTSAGLAEQRARLQVAESDVKVAEANVETIQTRITDATLTSPVLGRVLYRLAEPGEVVAAGGKVLTLVNLEDVYMEIFLPAEQASGIQLGSEARFLVDFQRERPVVGYVSFVSPEAQFTPKEVETRSEREKLMFRVKIQVPRELVTQYVERIKTGVRGVGYVRIDETVPWPAFLERNLVRPRGPARTEAAPASPPPEGR